MKVDQDLQFSKNQLEKLNKSQRSLVSSRQEEINNLEKMYDEKKANTRYNGEDELLGIRDRNQAEVAQQLIEKKERLGSIKSSFDDARKMLEQERELLIASHQEKVQDLNSVYNDKYKRSFDDASSTADDLNSKTSQTLANIESEADQRIVQSTFTSKVRSDEKDIENAGKLADQERSHLREQKTATKSYARKSAESMMDHEKELIDQNYGQLSERKSLESIHQNEISVKNEQHKDLLMQEDKSFKEKYANIAKEHQSVLDRIKNKFGQQINTLLNKQSSSKAVINNKNDDSFYKITTLEPELVNLEKSYEVTLKIPEHEKENVRLTAKGRDITLSLTRKFSERAVAQDGSENKSSRSEMFSKNISTTDLMNSREIRQSYNDGVLTFNIAKL